MGIFSKWKPKTIVGKILKGTTIGLGVAATAATGIGAVAGIVTGGGALAGAIAGGGAVVKAVKGAGTVAKTVTSKVAGGAINLVTGMNKEQREIVKDIKEEAKEAKDKQQFAQKLINLGKTESEANALAGIVVKESEAGTVKESGLLGFLQEKRMEGEKTQLITGTNKNLLMYAGLGLASLFVLPALFSGKKSKLF